MTTQMPPAPTDTKQISAWYDYAELMSSDQLEADRATLWNTVCTSTDLREQLNAEAAIEIIDNELEARSEMD